MVHKPLVDFLVFAKYFSDKTKQMMMGLPSGYIS